MGIQALRVTSCLWQRGVDVIGSSASWQDVQLSHSYYRH